jgi:ATP-dependent Lon protease
MNPVILLDEFDKVSGSEKVRSDFMAILLEILDPQQNQTFRDLYIDYPVDLSKILFIATANKLNTVSRELLDRLEVIQFEDYNKEEKVVIAKRYLYPQVLEYAGLQPQEFQFTEEAWPVIIDIFGRDPGVRRLERNLQRLARKAIKQIILGQAQSVTMTPDLARQYSDEALPSIEKIRDLDYTAKKQISRVDREEGFNSKQQDNRPQRGNTKQQANNNPQEHNNRPHQVNTDEANPNTGHAQQTNHPQQQANPNNETPQRTEMGQNNQANTT